MKVVPRKVTFQLDLLIDLSDRAILELPGWGGGGSGRREKEMKIKEIRVSQVNGRGTLHMMTVFLYHKHLFVKLLFPHTLIILALSGSNSFEYFFIACTSRI